MMVAQLKKVLRVTRSRVNRFGKQVRKAVEGHDYRYRYNSYVTEMRKQVVGCHSLLDVGCGQCSPLSNLDFDYSVGIEGHAESALRASKRRTHSEIVHGDIIVELGKLDSNSFDVVAGLDVIEHLEKQDGYFLIQEMERVARNRVLLVTPNGFLPQSGSDGDLQEHLSGWSSTEMRELGFDVTGLWGPRALRGEYHYPRFRPRALWGLFAELLDYAYTRKHADLAAGLLCVKRLP